MEFFLGFHIRYKFILNSVCHFLFTFFTTFISFFLRSFSDSFFLFVHAFYTVLIYSVRNVFHKHTHTQKYNGKHCFTYKYKLESLMQIAKNRRLLQPLMILMKNPVKIFRCLKKTCLMSKFSLLEKYYNSWCFNNDFLRSSN